MGKYIYERGSANGKRVQSNMVRVGGRMESGRYGEGEEQGGDRGGGEEEGKEGEGGRERLETVQIHFTTLN